ncbi:hypothetical protein [Methanobrevibacter sp.]|uniref:hypothetical protein n=1 Tax=Methanobrevibacter sp. TaxID=66852 RepID=UPI00388EF915
MFNYYDVDVIPIILNRFKVKEIVVCGKFDEQILNQISECDVNSIQYISKDFNNNPKESSLTILPNLSNYDAIFINDDPNWYTVYNELKIIKETNKSNFPLVFICNNVFPHKRRDSYFYPELIPKEFRNNCSKDFLYGDLTMYDGLFHAIDENTPNNGVLTAIEDFLSENNSIGVLNIKLVDGTTILYPKNSISIIRLGILNEELQGHDLELDVLLDNLVESQFLRDYFLQLDVSPADKEKLSKLELQLEEKEKIIGDYKDKVNLHDNELSYKDSQINGINSKLSLRDAQIKNIESKLINSENEISNLSKKLLIANNQIDSLKDKIDKEEKYYKNNELKLNNQISEANSLINSLKSDIHQKEQIKSNLNNKLQIANSQIKETNEQLANKNINISKKDNQIKTKQKELIDMESKLNLIKRQYNNQFSKLDSKEYCISCYKEEIINNNLEIEYLKKDILLRKVLSPFSYLLLIFKSNPKELSLNFKLYNALKNSKCFDIGFYLHNNEDIVLSRWCKYFSPELHYVCNGFNEERKFNKKYFNRNSKEELLDYILKCQ